ncbi:hypothetical protein EVAR_71885_1 [Eumeta japonica]|uniref:Uncharacterized protein n=1 Tax=Eumeta variegata TaxID=151549 RepID=A0A4C1T6D8_EUMVA|nr:hypothetical protein EVAR_71885_1 [Eumeta japonica]
MWYPDGSSVSAAICLTLGVIGNPNVDYLSWALNWGVAYDLPNYDWASKHADGFLIVQKPLSKDDQEEIYMRSSS